MTKKLLSPAHQWGDESRMNINIKVAIMYGRSSTKFPHFMPIG
jgi:hypothetical protein